MKRFFVATIIGILIVVLWVGAASAKGTPKVVKVVISSGSLSAPAEIHPFDIGAFQRAWWEESMRLQVEPPTMALGEPVAFLHIWLSRDPGRPKPDVTVEYYRVGDSGLLHTPIQEGEYMYVGREFWYRTSPAMEALLQRYLGLPPLPSQNPERAAAFPWLWVSIALAVVVAAVFLIFRQPVMKPKVIRSQRFTTLK